MNVKKNRRVFRKRVVGALGKKRYRKCSGVSSAVKAYVKRTIHANIEDKTIQVNQSQSFGTILESPDMNVFPCCAQTGYWLLPQSVGQGGRISNRIRLRSVMLNYVLRPRAYDATFNPNPLPCHVMLFLGYVKNSPSFVPDSVDFNELFQGGSSVNPPTGGLKDLLLPINKDYWNIKKRWTHKIGFADVAGTGASAANEYHSNNDFKYNVVKKLDITRMCPKINVFNDGAGGTNTKNLYFFYQAVAANGNIIASPFTPCTIDYWLDIRYEDA